MSFKYSQNHTTKKDKSSMIFICLICHLANFIIMIIEKIFLYKYAGGETILIHITLDKFTLFVHIFQTYLSHILSVIIPIVVLSNVVQPHNTVQKRAH